MKKTVTVTTEIESNDENVALCDYQCAFFSSDDLGCWCSLFKGEQKMTRDSWGDAFRLDACLEATGDGKEGER